MGNRFTPKLLFLSCLAAFLAFFPSAEALVINSYSDNPALYDRFSPGTYDVNPTFFASSYDWSGVGWNTIDPSQSIAMISPLHFVCANHYPISSRPGESPTVTFRNRNGVLKKYTVDRYSTFGDGIHTPDLALGWLAGDIPDDALISHYPVLNAEDPETSELDPYWYLNKDIYVYGWDARVGENVINNFALAYSIEEPPQADLTFCSTFDYYDSPTYYYPGLAGCQGGDSGSPTFIPWNGQLTVLGTHFAISAIPPAESWTTYDAFIPYYLDEINVAMASGSLYSVDVINVIPEPMTCILFLAGLPYLLIRQRR